MNGFTQILEKLREHILELEPTANAVRQNEILEGVFERSLPKLLNDFIEGSKEQRYITLNDHAFLEQEFVARLKRRWHEPFDLLRFFTIVSLEIVEEIGKNPDSYYVDGQKNLFVILLKLHARSIQVAREIHVLMSNGYADGALSRWRTLHEICVILKFIFENGENTAIMYTDFIVVESSKELATYSDKADILGFKAVEKEVEDHFSAEIDRLKIKYGNDFVKDYGWTSQVLLRKEDRNFTGVEKSVGLDWLRPFYKWACNPTHGGAKTAFTPVGLYQDELIDSDFYHLAGPTNYGFADCAQLTAFSLLEITKTLAGMFPSYDSRFAIKYLEALFEDVKDKFCDTQMEIESEEEQKKK